MKIRKLNISKKNLIVIGVVVLVIIGGTILLTKGGSKGKGILGTFNLSNFITFI